MKKTATIVGIILLAGLIAYPVFARGPGWGWGPGHPMMGYGGGFQGGYCGYGGYGGYGGGYATLTQEQQKELDQLYQKFYGDTVDLRNQMGSKSAELDALLNAPAPDIEKAKTLQGEISDLRAKLAENRLELELKARKIAPDTQRGWGYFGGYGPHMRGYGRYMGGYGPDMRGYGPGTCWK